MQLRLICALFVKKDETHEVGRKMATMLPKIPVKAKRKMKPPETRPASRKLISMALGEARKALSARTGSKKG